MPNSANKNPIKSSPLAAATKDKQFAKNTLPNYQNDGPVVSFFEFWPSWLIYIPVVLHWLALSIKYRSTTLPLIANPSIFLSGMVGESKSEVLALAKEQARQWISPYITLTRNAHTAIEQQTAHALTQLATANIIFPVVAKPDLGCRGAGVRLIENAHQLAEYLTLFPIDQRYLLQQKAPYESEAGIFYIRHPQHKQGFIFSLTLKYQPYVKGDGLKTLRQLIEADSRARLLTHLYFPRHAQRLDTVIAADEEVRLAFAGNHCRGSIFRNGAQFISPELCARLDEIFDAIPNLHYSRIDVKFKDIDSLMAGKNLTFLEINGASSEATHIWDNRSTLKEVYRSLFFQYATLFKLGAAQRAAGVRTPSLFCLLSALLKEKKLVAQYPSTD